MKKYINEILIGDSSRMLKKLPAKIFHTCVTSPPYYKLRDYGVDNQIGLESTPEQYIKKLVTVFREVKRVLRDDGTLWIVVGDSYNGSGKANNDKTIDNYLQGSNKHSTVERTHIKGIKRKDLIGISWLLAFALRNDGWYWRDTIIWHKCNPMPESVLDRCTRAHEYILFFSKNSRYYFNSEAIKTPSKNPKDDRGSRGNIKRIPTKMVSGIRSSGVYPMSNKRNVWTVATQPFKGAHYAVFPEQLIEPCIKAGCPEAGLVLDPFIGSGTTGLVARKLSRNFVGIDLNPDNKHMALERMNKELGLFT